MSFTYPYALLILIAIPILILIYILKNKYREQTTSSTYLWELSNKFLKKRNPLHRMEHLLSLILQSLTIAAMAFALAKPTFIQKGKADGIAFVLDGSASMQIEKDGTTRFDEAKAKIKEVENKARNGSTFSLILAGNEPETVCTSISDKLQFERFLDQVEVSDEAADVQSSMALAQQMFTEGKANVCYVASDKTFADGSTNVQFLNVGDDAVNNAVTSVSSDYDTTNRKLTLKCSVLSYGRDANLQVDFLVTKSDGTQQTFRTDTLPCKADAEFDYEYTLDDDSNSTFSSLTSIEAKLVDNTDSLALDDSRIVYENASTGRSKVLLVSDKPFYLQAALKATKLTSVRTVSASSYTPSSTSYDITIFDNYTPAELPTSGAVWLFNPTTDIPDCGFRYQYPQTVDGGVYLDYAQNDNSLIYQQMTRSLNTDNTKDNTKKILVHTYQRLLMEESFTTILTYSNLPVVFAGKNAAHNGQREVVFAFDLRESNLPLLYDFPALVRNFIQYSDPQIVSEFSYTVGDKAQLSISDKAQSIEIVSPDEKSDYLDLGDSEVSTLELSEVGTYTINVVNNDGTTKTAKIFASFPKEEGKPTPSEDKALVLTPGANTKKVDGIFDSILPWVIALAVLFMADWILYAYEQY